MASKLDIAVLSGVSAGDVFHFTVAESGSVSIGRATECDLVLQDPMVSRKHLQVERKSDGFYIVDQGSTHGTFHMGFHLKAGPDGARKLHSGDEFKIGDLLFRVSFEEEEFAPKKAAVTAADTKRPKASILDRLPPALQGKKGALAGGLVALLLLLLLLAPGEAPGLPKQKNDVIKIPNYGVIGFWPAGDPKKNERDTAHIDKAQFDIPASDIVVEFDFVGEVKANVLLDDLKLDELAPSPGSWQIRQVIIRGLALGTQRRLTVDNLDFPSKNPQAAAKPKRWAVRDVRAAPLTTKFGIEPGFDSHLGSAYSLIEGIDKNPEGLFLLIRALQTAAVELMKELKIDAAGFVVEPGAEAVAGIANPAELRQRLDVIKRGREQEFSTEASSSYLKELTRIISQLDAELWRRVNNRFNEARLSSRVKNYIEAHDSLISVQSMFPAEADYRWTLADRMLKDKKVVPKRIRENPQDYRK